MADLEHEIRERYLDRLDEATWDDCDPCLDYGAQALPYFIAAFEAESTPSRRARLVRAIWQFRDMAALSTLAMALNDSASEVWKDALDGIVTLGGRQALAVLTRARTALAACPAETERLAWIDEAAAQVAKSM